MIVIIVCRLNKPFDLTYALRKIPSFLFKLFLLPNNVMVHSFPGISSALYISSWAIEYLCRHRLVTELNCR
jgi:hypothetical protein